jgi:hypothetical protein
MWLALLTDAVLLLVLLVLNACKCGLHLHAADPPVLPHLFSPSSSMVYSTPSNSCFLPADLQHHKAKVCSMQDWHVHGWTSAGMCGARPMLLQLGWWLLAEWTWSTKVCQPRLAICAATCAWVYCWCYQPMAAE